jgi:hypothetical protein
VQPHQSVDVCLDVLIRGIRIVPLTYSGHHVAAELYGAIHVSIPKPAIRKGSAPRERKDYSLYIVLEVTELPLMYNPAPKAVAIVGS